VFSDGTPILLSNCLASFIHPGDEVRFPLTLDAAGVTAQIQIRNKKRIIGRGEIFQAAIGYATQPRKDKRGNLYVLAEVVSPCLGVSAVQLRCETLRDASMSATATAHSIASNRSTNCCGAVPKHL
jgi:hypothetical protein